MRVNPIQSPGKPGFRVTFRNPYRGKVTSAGLGTRDEITARAICADIEALSDRRDLWSSPESPELLAYDEQAVAAFFGTDSEHFKARQGKTPPRALMRPEEAEALGSVEGHRALLEEAAKHTGAVVNAPALDEVLKRIDASFFAEHRDLRERCRRLELEVKAAHQLRQRNQYLEAELAKLHRRENMHAKVTVLEAVQAFEPALRTKRNAKSQKAIRDALTSFVADLPLRGRERLGEIKAVHIDDYLVRLRKKDGAEPAARTRKKRRASLSVFLGWAVKRYDLFENPITKADRVTDAARTMDSIVAIERLEDLEQLLEGLRPWPYWQAWVSFACLAGLRWGEQRRLALDDVKVSEGYTVVRATKTGRIRRVHIERTFLRDVLTEHLKRREAERKSPTLPGHASPWVFPSIVPDNEYKPRVKTAPGLWSDASVWHAAWERVQNEAKARKVYKPAWAHGPAVWRHTFGTALAKSGLTEVQIAQLMGNSTEVAKRHYISDAIPERPWPFVWLARK